MNTQDVIKMHQALCHEPLPDEEAQAVAEAVNKYSPERAKANFLAYKHDGGEKDGLEWCYDNEPALFARWQSENQISGDWIYYPAPNGKGAIR